MDSALLCENISRKIGDFELKNIDFLLPAGCIMGVIGRNGCGKTTLIRCLTGVYRLAGKNITDAGGNITINGFSINQDEKNYKKQYAFVSHECYFKGLHRVKEIGQLLGYYYNGFSMKSYMDNLTRFDVPAKKTVGELSKGQKLRLQLAFALSYDARVYIFDEPAANLDVEFRDEFYKIIRELVSDGEKSVVYVSHMMEELEEIADYILWIKKQDNVGTVKYFGTIDELKESYRMFEGGKEVLVNISRNVIVGGRKRESHEEWLVKNENLGDLNNKQLRYADLKEIMYYEEKGEIR